MGSTNEARSIYWLLVNWFSIISTVTQQRSSAAFTVTSPHNQFEWKRSCPQVRAFYVVFIMTGGAINSTNKYAVRFMKRKQHTSPLLLTKFYVCVFRYPMFIDSLHQAAALNVCHKLWKQCSLFCTILKYLSYQVKTQFSYWNLDPFPEPVQSSYQPKPFTHTFNVNINFHLNLPIKYFIQLSSYIN